MKVVIGNEESTSEKTFTKQVDSVMEEGDLITLIFKNQHEKYRSEVLKKYNVLLYLQAQDGFERKIWDA